MIGLRLRAASRHWVAAIALLIGPIQAGLAAPYVPYPSEEAFRKIQLATLACARENTAEACQTARSLADPLMDHPRLPSSCKDVAWAIREAAKPAAVNTYPRQDELANAAQTLMRVCRAVPKPPSEAELKAKPDGNSGLKFGGSGN